MADTKISALPAITTITSTDVLPIADLSEVTTKKITVKQMQEASVGASPTFVELTLSNLTAKSIPFASTGGLISQNNTALSWDNTKGKLKVSFTAIGATPEILGNIESIITDSSTIADHMRAISGIVLSGNSNTLGSVGINGVVYARVNAGEHTGISGFAYADDANSGASTGLWGGDFHAVSFVSGAAPEVGLMRGIEVGVHPRRADISGAIGVHIQNIKNFVGLANFQGGTALKIEGATYDDRAGWLKYIQGYKGSTLNFEIDNEGRVGIGVAADPVYQILASRISGNIIMLLNGADTVGNQETYIDLIGRSTGNVIRGRFLASTGSVVMIGAQSNHALVFITNATEKGRFSAGGSFYVKGDDATGLASAVGLTNVSDLTANSTGIGTILFKGTTSRNSSGFMKIYIDTTAYYIPVFSAIGG